MDALVRDFQTDSLTHIRKFLDARKGPYYYFRTQTLKLQNRFVELFPVAGAPLVFLHGNPHVDNYARTNTGCGMIDFDRSRIGPYAWDIARLLASLSLRQKSNAAVSLKSSVIQAVNDAYISRLQDPRLGYEPFGELQKREPRKSQLSTNSYMEANKKWAKKMRAHPIAKTDARLQILLKGYARSRNKPHFLEKYSVAEAGVCIGSLGQPRFLVWLRSNERSSDSILLDIKEVYRDPDTEFFYNPYIHHGHRMVEASQLYAPGVEQRIGYANLGGQEFWVRQIPPFQAKVKGLLSEKAVQEFAYCVACQLAIGHGRSLLFTKPEKLLSNFKKNLSLMADVAEKLAEETVKAHAIYKEKAQAEIMSISAKKKIAKP